MSPVAYPRGSPTRAHITARTEAVEEDAALKSILITPVPPIEEVIVLVPALDEEKGIGLVLDTIPFETLQDMGCEVSVLVVDGVSRDATREIAQRKGAHVLVQSGEGKGNGVRQAFARIMSHQAQYLGYEHRQFVIMLDADGTYPAEDIPRILTALREGNDVVLGSRLTGRIEPGAMTNLNRAGNRILSRIARTLYGVPVTDVCTGMWGFSQDFLEECDLQAKGFELEAEIFASAALLRAPVAEVPIDYRRRQGTPKMVPLRTGVRIAWCLIQKRARGLQHVSTRMRTRTWITRGTRHENLPTDS